VLEGDCLTEAVGDVKIESKEPERSLAWKADGATGTAKLEPSSWGTKVTLTAETEGQVAELGFWARIRGIKPEPPRHDDIEDRLTRLLDTLGSAHRKPFSNE
jgi:hypothetical protein